MTGLSRLRIGLIGPARFPIAEPFIGGLEAHVWNLSRALKARGHVVTLFAAAGSDPNAARWLAPFPRLDSADDRRRDVSEAADLVAAEDLAYQTVMRRLASDRGAGFDVIHNHSLHPTPLAFADQLDVPLISTFHTPPIGRVARTLQASMSRNIGLVAVSRHAAELWSTVVPGEIDVVHNGVDIDDWTYGPGGRRLVWSGRLVPEKGADLAIDAAAMTGCPLDLAGPIIDHDYFRSAIQPRLGERVRYLGHLTQGQLAHAVGHSAVALVTPRWDEPFGLVVAEALACGTPVAAFARGGIPEIVSDRAARLARPDDVTALAAAIGAAWRLNRRDVRKHAERACSLTQMVTAYEQIYRARVSELPQRRLSHPWLSSGHSAAHVGQTIVST